MQKNAAGKKQQLCAAIELHEGGIIKDTEEMITLGIFFLLR